MADVEVDLSQLTQLVADLRSHSRKTPAAAALVVAKGARNIKQDWARTWAGLRHAPALAAAVTYDTNITRGGVEAEIGPDKNRRQGALGNIVEFGTAKNGSIPGGAPALDREEPKFEAAVGVIVAGLLK